MNSSTSSELSFSGEQPSLRRSHSTPSLCCGGSTAAECCGGTTAECAALCCCGPCSVVKLVVLAVYKLPRGICRRATRRLRRRRLAKKGALESGDFEKKLSKSGSSQFAVHPLQSYGDEEEEEEEEEEEDEAVIALENEMWSRFCSGGFWRSHSQAETASSSKMD
ncbi:hypothetical protein EUTSA_v10016087mg [Eutrema salsugineum]|uniref:Uncharacterized protein n=1 Tax=Eutrema salsugineum TaxID=72664 RepID=V4LDV6_EUTSA|nr:uncharacterized protein LOC18016515 [Eutrema salsugineum]ESQ40562.1 hypothetical protein EUTSA_v10016087mg [Eutrema salsugineum]